MPNLTMHTDKYQINMMYAHWKNKTHLRKAVFEAYFRKLPFDNGYAVFAGTKRIVDYIQDIVFTESDLDYLSEQPENYDNKFLSYLRNLKFTGTLSIVPEGTIVFANEPLVRVESTIIEAQLVETAILNFLGYQTLIATKAARIKQVAPKDKLIEMGTRRAQESEAAQWGARAAYIAGFDATSNVQAGQVFGIPIAGTHAHAWVQSHDSELEAFRSFVNVLPNQSTLLVDTYSTLKSGVPNAIIVGKEMEARGEKLQAIRLDSGDLAYLSKEARKMLDQAGLDYVKIVASNDLDETTILNLKAQGALIDIWGIGTQLITAADNPSLGCVYKLVESENTVGEMVPVIKISENPEKIPMPGVKNLHRLVSKETGMILADYMTDITETMVETEELVLRHHIYEHMTKKITNFDVVDLLQVYFLDGQFVGKTPDIEEIKIYCKAQLKLFWPEYLRILNPEVFPVNYSEHLVEQRKKLIVKNMTF